ncbi:MAG TPA: hypothetical protein PLP61_14955 [Nocardioides sp.]|uniref:hypothetical protein n=1 Tax=Nocardioides sp. TaxID=35761 RepID=UPI002BD6F76C|nr:hypothetical protein [Nocardioides sp.]HQR28339.1 hypothetical protein [Nocardioides sp.]
MPESRKTRTARGVLVALWILTLLAACAGKQGEPPTAAPGPRSTATPAPSPATRVSMPCDPGGGFPQPRRGCPDQHPTTAWLTAYEDGRATLEPFRTYVNDAAGRAYAREHDLEFPFPNDYHDAPVGAAFNVELSAQTVCTGIIVIGYREPLRDHRVSCDKLSVATQDRPVPAALWWDGDRVVQVSELYRP